MSVVPPLLAHADYVEPAFYREERERLFGRCWLCLGLAAEGARTVATAGLEIAVGADGAASCDGRAVATGRAGGLLFASLAAAPPPLAEWLDPYGPWLEAATAGLGAADRTGRAEVAANWKLLVENTLDDCHAGTVHAASLAPSLPDWRTDVAIARHGAHSEIRHGLAARDRAYWAGLVRRLGVRRHGAGEDYRHVFLFPNLYLASFCDAALMLHRIEPLGPERSALHWQIALPAGRPAEGARATMRRAVLDELAAQAARVVAEDLAIVALAQRGRHFAVHPGVLSTRERRSLDFQAVIRAMLTKP